MSVRNEELIAATTGAVTSGGFTVVGTATVMASALASGETVTIQQTHNGTDWQDTSLNLVSQVITLGHTAITLLGPGKFRCVKSVTAGSVGVNLWITEAM